MSQLICRHPAQIQPDTRRLFIQSSVVSGISLLKDAGHIFRRDADACIRNRQLLPVIYCYRHGAFCCIFDCIGKKLFNDKSKPLFVCNHPCVRPLIDEAYPAPDELSGVFAHSLSHDIIQRILLYEQIRRAFPEADIRQRHIRVLLHTEQFRRQLPVLRRIFLLEQDLHDRNGCFDLVHPHGIIIIHIPACCLPLAFLCAVCRLDAGNKRLVILFRKCFRRRERARNIRKRSFCHDDMIQFPVFPAMPDISQYQKDHTEYDRDNQGIPHGS